MRWCCGYDRSARGFDHMKYACRESLLCRQAELLSPSPLALSWLAYKSMQRPIQMDTAMDGNRGPDLIIRVK
jgi:hypothetical protein